MKIRINKIKVVCYFSIQYEFFYYLEECDFIAISTYISFRFSICYL